MNCDIKIADFGLSALVRLGDNYDIQESSKRKGYKDLKEVINILFICSLFYFILFIYLFIKILFYFILFYYISTYFKLFLNFNSIFISINYIFIAYVILCSKVEYVIYYYIK